MNLHDGYFGSDLVIANRGRHMRRHPLSKLPQPPQMEGLRRSTSDLTYTRFAFRQIFSGFVFSYSE
ncbi:hypothetical protein AVEN_182604-1, partial [Araneus ventricosus]